MMFRHCSSCGQDIPLTEWRKHRETHRRGGKGANRKQKLRARERSNGLCANCGEPPPEGEVLEVHHRDGNWRNNDKDNLVALCGLCHVRADAALRKPHLIPEGQGSMQSQPELKRQPLKP